MPNDQNKPGKQDQQPQTREPDQKQDQRIDRAGVKRGDQDAEREPQKHEGGTKQEREPQSDRGMGKKHEGDDLGDGDEGIDDDETDTDDKVTENDTKRDF